MWKFPREGTIENRIAKEGGVWLCRFVSKEMVSQPKKARLHMDRDEAGNAVILLAGYWSLEADRTDGNRFLEDEGARKGIRRFLVRDAGLEAWDSGLLVFVRALVALAGMVGAQVDVSGLPKGARELLRLASEVPAQAEHVAAKAPSWLARVGMISGACFAQTGDALRFFDDLVRASVRFFRGKARYRRRDFFVVLQECGPEALPILSLLSLLVGIILAFLGSVQLKMFGAEIFTANAVAIGMTREMGALMTGIIMAGRTGAAFAARLGTMQVNEEVDALQTMGFSPMEYLVVPRALALMVMMPLLALYAVVMGMFGGALVGVLMLDLTPAQYLHQSLESISLWGVCSGLIKAAVFGGVVAVSGCMQGIRCGRSAESVGVATTAAVVHSIVWIVVMDSVISVFYTMFGL